MSLQLSDLFQSRGRCFNYRERLGDQQKLVDRLRQFPELTSFANELQEFCDQHIASMTYLDYILADITKSCSEKNITID
jgi:hypothetical protein